MSEITKIDQYDLESWNKVHAYLESRTYPAEDVIMDFTSADFVEDGLHLTGMVGVFVPVNVYRKDEPPSPEALDLQRLRDLAERALRALDEDSFPQLRQDLRDALGTPGSPTRGASPHLSEATMPKYAHHTHSEGSPCAMRRAGEGPGGQLAALQTLIPHVLHYATLPHAHSGAYRDAADALALVAKATGEQA